MVHEVHSLDVTQLTYEMMCIGLLEQSFYSVDFVEWAEYIVALCLCATSSTAKRLQAGPVDEDQPVGIEMQAFALNLRQHPVTRTCPCRR